MSARIVRPLVRVLVITGLLVEIVLPLAIFAGRNRLLFFPAAAPLPEEPLAGNAFHASTARVTHVLRKDGRRLAAYDISPARLSDGAPVVLFLHGNAGNIATRAEIAAELSTQAGVRVFMPDYSGYGNNAGSPSERELETDALAAYDHLIADSVPPQQIVVYGESIGGAPAIVVATERRVAGLALQSTFSSLSSMTRQRLAWMPLAAWLMRDAFPNATRLATVRVPVFIVHGTDDEVIPFSEGQRLAAAAPEGTTFLRMEGVGHNDLIDIGGRSYLSGLGARFRGWVPPPIARDSAPEIDGFIARHYAHDAQTKMAYRLFVPKGYDRAKRYPLVVWLHGAGAVGTDNKAQLRGDQIPGTHTWITAENQARHAAFVMAPQTASGWGDQSLALVLAIVDSLKRELSIDPSRVYVAGQSLGGAGTWRLIMSKSHPFAAAIVLCGSSADTSRAAHAASVPVWVFQGDQDVPGYVETSRVMVEGIKRAGGMARYTEYAGMGHAIWIRVFKEPELVDWLFAQRR